MDSLHRLKRRLSKRSFPNTYDHSAHPYAADECDTVYVRIVVMFTCLHLAYVI